MDILPSDLATYGQDAKELLKTLQSRNERMFQLTFLVLNTADTRQKLENFAACSVAYPTHSARRICVIGEIIWQNQIPNRKKNEKKTILIRHLM